MEPIRLTHRLELGALGTLFWHTVRRHIRARRLIVLAVLFLLPAGFAIFARALDPDFPRKELELGLVFYFIPHGLIPLTALLYSSGMIQDELEEQTLTYLLIRPLPRWGVYLAKFLATWLVTALLAAVFTFVTYTAIHYGSPTFWTEILPRTSPITVGLMSLDLLGYCGLFGWTSLLVRRSFILGVAYIIIFEGIIANIDFAVRKLTVMYYFRVLAERWLKLDNRPWDIDLTLAPDAARCLWILGVASAVLIFLAIRTFTSREWRVKTPEGS
jgi:ABC-2 type transport system permease protein